MKAAAVALLACPLFTWAQNSTASVVVTVGHFDIQDTLMPAPADMIVTGDPMPLRITSLSPLRGDRAALELFLVVDNCSSCGLGAKFDDLRRFILSQPATTTIGVAYNEEGCLRIAEGLTSDRQRVIQALNLPGNSEPSSPFGALSELIGGWEQTGARRAVLVISNGIDPDVNGGIDPPAEAAIQAAQRAGVITYAIYQPRADWTTTDPSALYWGQILLAHVAYETGGQAYFSGLRPLTSLAPFLADIADHLANQYLLEFFVKPGEGHELQPITVRSKIEDFDVLAPAKIWIPK